MFNCSADAPTEPPLPKHSYAVYRQIPQIVTEQGHGSPIPGSRHNAAFYWCNLGFVYAAGEDVIAAWGGISVLA